MTVMRAEKDVKPISFTVPSYGGNLKNLVFGHIFYKGFQVILALYSYHGILSMIYSLLLINYL